jgi:hypothetical protein
MRWKILLEGTDEVGSAHRSELAIDKDMERLSAEEIGWQGYNGSSPADGLPTSNARLWQAQDPDGVWPR